MPTRKKSKRTEAELIEQIRAGVIEVAALIELGFTYLQVQGAINSGLIRWTEGGDVALTEAVLATTAPAPDQPTTDSPVKPKRGRLKAVAKQEDAPIPEPPGWLILLAQQNHTEDHLAAVWLRNAGFRKRASSVKDTRLAKWDMSGTYLWPADSEKARLYRTAMQYGEVTGPKIVKCVCEHQLALANGVAGDAAVWCPGCNHTLRFDLDGSPLRCEARK